MNTLQTPSWLEPLIADNVDRTSDVTEQEITCLESFAQFNPEQAAALIAAIKKYTEVVLEALPGSSSPEATAPVISMHSNKSIIKAA
ncbi:MAG: hypothetical protein KGO82_05650 [Bacteroidota bacterium]|nr:hypothetical protein [Bacteroidota bacterium]